MADDAKQRLAYAFLREHALSSATFTLKDLGSAVGWTGTTPRSYASKQYRDYLQQPSRGVYRVIRAFKRVTWDEFRELVTQVQYAFAVYDRATYYGVVVYDFLMPLTREDKLRKGLDELFYRDTLERRIEEIWLEVLGQTIP